MYKKLVGDVMRGFTENTSTQTRYSRAMETAYTVCHAEKTGTYIWTRFYNCTFVKFKVDTTYKVLLSFILFQTFKPPNLKML